MSKSKNFSNKSILDKIVMYAFKKKKVGLCNGVKNAFNLFSHQSYFYEDYQWEFFHPKINKITILLKPANYEHEIFFHCYLYVYFNMWFRHEL